MSKSRGTFITARSYLDRSSTPSGCATTSPGKSNGTMEDVDLNLDDMIAKVNSDLVGKFVNIASRCAGFIAKRFDGKLAMTHDRAFGRAFNATGTADEIAAGLRNATSAKPRARSWSSRTSQRVVNDNKPWELAKLEGQDACLHAVCSPRINFFRPLPRYLSPVLPTPLPRSKRLPGIAPNFITADASAAARRPRHQRYSHLMTRIERKRRTPPRGQPQSSPGRRRSQAGKGPPRTASEQRHAQHQAHAAATEPPRPTGPSSRIDDFTSRPAYRQIVPPRHVEGAPSFACA